MKDKLTNKELDKWVYEKFPQLKIKCCPSCGGYQSENWDRLFCEHCDFKTWKPTEDIKQAFECEDIFIEESTKEEKALYLVELLILCESKSKEDKELDNLLLIHASAEQRMNALYNVWKYRK